jgi:hypothetical protein
MCLHAKHVFSNQFGWYLSFNCVITEKYVYFDNDPSSLSQYLDESRLKNISRSLLGNDTHLVIGWSFVTGFIISWKKYKLVYKHNFFFDLQGLIRDRPFNLKGGLWFFVSFRIFFSDSTRVRIFIFFVVQSAKFFSRIQH